MARLERLVVGISGASCTGKTTLTKLLKATFPWASVVHQDGYYHPNDPKFHIYLHDVKHFNWDIKSALDFPKMETHLEKLLHSQQEQDPNRACENTEKDQQIFLEQLLCFPNGEFVNRNRPQLNEIQYLTSKFSKIPLTILEGHIIFSHPPFFRMCDFKYFLTLDKDELFARRKQRVYNPPNPPGYLEKYVWPAYAARLEEVQKLPSIQYVNANSVPLTEIFHKMKQSITFKMAEMISPTPSIEDNVRRRVNVNQKG